jgi:hypothetical protein
VGVGVGGGRFGVVGRPRGFVAPAAPAPPPAGWGGAIGAGADAGTRSAVLHTGQRTSVPIWLGSADSFVRHTWQPNTSIVAD